MKKSYIITGLLIVIFLLILNTLNIIAELNPFVNNIGNTKEDEIPINGIPYTEKELKDILILETKNIEVQDKTLDEIISEIRPRIKTFTGNKYKLFEPVLSVDRGSPEATVFLLSGNGYIDDNAYDGYYILIRWDEESADIIEESIAWRGIPIEYKKMAEKIARENEEIMNKTPYLIDVRWIPEKLGQVQLFFDDMSAIPESPMAFIIVDLNTKEIISIEKRYWDGW
ncbi:MAG: hypothetical protein ABIH25_00300 [Candidatus Woesearchaeota archaeon]